MVRTHPKITVPMNEILLEKLKREASASDRSVSYVVRRILGEHFGILGADGTYASGGNVEQSHGERKRHT